MSSNPCQFALRVAVASDTLARLHREAVAQNAQSSRPGETTSCSRQSASAVARERHVLQLAQRLAAAAETLAESQKENASCGAQVAAGLESRSMISSSTPAVKIAAAVAKDARRAADRQARRSSVPKALDIEVLGPEWAQRLFRERERSLKHVSGDDVEVCLTTNKYKLELTCPLSAGRLKVPVRGQHCRHVECFDLESLRHSAPKAWRCPMFGCDAAVAPVGLRRDAFMEAMLQQVDASSCTITLSPNFLNAKMRGSLADRASALVKLACSSNSEAGSTIPKQSSPCAKQKGSPAIELIDSDSEVRPRRKHARKMLYTLNQRALVIT
mmetsp:Transcript_20093/g.36296  ORF Transcript_20093/g.36296 Transcript_20093/m.36296 type:complete len:328 (-) Transcript_20093:33-1016(-)